MLPRPLNTRLPQSNRSWRKVSGKTANYLPAIPLLKWTYHPLCTQICAYVGMPAYLCIWAELGVYIISAWVCCNYTVKVPMGRQLLRLALRHIPLILLCLFAWQKKKMLCLSVCMLTDGNTYVGQSSIITSTVNTFVCLYALSDTIQSACVLRISWLQVCACWLGEFSVGI